MNVENQNKIEFLQLSKVMEDSIKHMSSKNLCQRINMQSFIYIQSSLHFLLHIQTKKALGKLCTPYDFNYVEVYILEKLKITI